jgi:hypothetical protein
MFSGREEHALLHQTSGVADAGYIAAARLNPKIVEIGAAKHDTCIGRSRNQPKMAKDSRVKTDALGRDFALNGVL